MKSTGMTRRVDELGRIVLPKELRENMEIKEKDPIEIYTEGDLIILKKFQSNCLLCGKTTNLIQYKDKSFCKSCIDKLHNKIVN